IVHCLPLLGVGQTTLLKKVCDAVVSAGVSVSQSAAGGRECRLGQYVVHLQSFESLALPLFRDMREGCRRLFVIDEIRKMELFSRVVRQTLDASSCSILGTIPVPKGKPLALVEEVRSRQDVKIFMITKETRDVIFDDIVSAVQECLN
uniref:Nucleoside-triphosphatase, cancer-related n=1 Tax=Cyprinus carpio TaxID=7962 RepID=A0A8C1PI07_CYPCA